MTSKPEPRFFLPERSILEQAAGEQSYAIKNYCGSGPIAAAKRRRFQRALELACEIRADRVIDMGTGDGVFLPTLAHYYASVVALDLNPTHVSESQRLVHLLGLSNVQVICTRGTTLQQLSQQLEPRPDLMFLLETLEHVGSQPDMWGSKIQFLQDCFSLLREGGRIVISVPKMVGLILLFKNVVQRSLGCGYDAMTLRQLLRSSLLKDTDELEAIWSHGHVGFNHLKLDRHLRDHFAIYHRSETLISVFYVLGRVS